MKKLGQRYIMDVLCRLSEMSMRSFDGKCRANVTVFSDGTVEAFLESVREVSDDGYEDQRCKVKHSQSSYRITRDGLRKMLDDLESAEWTTVKKQTPQGARYELAEAKGKVKRIAQAYNHFKNGSGQHSQDVEKLCVEIGDALGIPF